MASAGDFIEVDFLAVETAKSGDAITIRYTQNGLTYIHVVDGGFSEMGPKIEQHLREYYTTQKYIDHVLLTHPDSDHANGLRYVLENCDVRALWMNRPWLYAQDLLPRFARFTSVENLRTRLRECYPTVVELESIADRRGIPIFEVFQGSMIGAFRVMAPSRSRFLDLVVDSERTPEAAADEAERVQSIFERALRVAKAAVAYIRAAWGEEVFSPNATSRENEMSVVQFIEFAGTKFLLTGDAGREALSEVVGYAPYVGLALPGIDRFQVPHHGSRRNVSTEVLDAILGPRLPGATTQYKFQAIISSAKEDEAHPRKAVVRAMHHRGGYVVATEGISIRSVVNAPPRLDYSPIAPLPYYEEQEE
jgi:beta-lactamase superfamily II metal-dependent hydrolase